LPRLVALFVLHVVMVMARRRMIDGITALCLECFIWPERKDFTMMVSGSQNLSGGHMIPGTNY
jgi:hypothetical protein